MAGLTLLGCLAVLASGLPIPAQLSLSPIAVVIGGLAIRRLIRPRIRGLRIAGATVVVHLGSKPEVSGRLVGLPFVSPLYVGFRWRPDGCRLPRSVGVFRSQMNEADFRRLCAELRQGSET